MGVSGLHLLRRKTSRPLKGSSLRLGCGFCDSSPIFPFKGVTDSSSPPFFFPLSLSSPTRRFFFFPSGAPFCQEGIQEHPPRHRTPGADLPVPGPPPRSSSSRRCGTAGPRPPACLSRPPHAPRPLGLARRRRRSARARALQRFPAPAPPLSNCGGGGRKGPGLAEGSPASARTELGRRDPYAGTARRRGKEGGGE